MKNLTYFRIDIEAWLVRNADNVTYATPTEFAEKMLVKHNNSNVDRIMAYDQKGNVRCPKLDKEDSRFFLEIAEDFVNPQYEKNLTDEQIKEQNVLINKFNR